MRNNCFIHFTALMMSGLLLVCGCSEELIPGGTPPPMEGPTLRYTIDNLTDGQATDAPTYAGTILAPTPNEAAIEEMTLLFFNVADTGNGTYVGYAKVDEATFKNPTVNAWEMHTTRITPPGAGTDSDLDGNKDYSVLAIANHSKNGWGLDQIKQVVEVPNATERGVKYALTVDTASAYREEHFLMSGSGKYSGKEKSVTIALRRNVAKVVLVNSLGLATFKLEKVWIANTRAQSYVMDMQGEMPVGMLKGVALNRGKELSTGVQTASFYCFEHYTETFSETGGLCLIIEGTFRGGAKRYYRLDVNVHEIDPASQQSVQRINRNALYKMTIVGVLGGGMNSIEEALTGVANQLVTHNGFYWEENYDGVYTYASNGIGFAPSVSILDQRMVNFVEGKINLYWSDHYTMMKSPPTDGTLTVESTNTSVITVTLSPERDVITYLPKSLGESVIKIKYNDAVVREIQVKFQSLIQSHIYIENLIVPKNNAGATPINPAGGFYTYTEAESACPSGYRLPSQAEIQDMFDKGLLKVAIVGFTLSLEQFDPSHKDIICLFPRAGKRVGGVVTEPTNAYYLTASVTGETTNPKRVIYKGDAAAYEVIKADRDDATTGYSVRCIGTQDRSKPYKFVDKADGGKIYMLKMSGLVTYAAYQAGLPPEGGFRVTNSNDSGLIDRILQNGIIPTGRIPSTNPMYWYHSLNASDALVKRYHSNGQLETAPFQLDWSAYGFYIKEIVTP